MVLRAQSTVVMDQLTHQPVAHANIFTGKGKAFRSAVTDEQGRVEVTFPFSRLTVSHLNYERLTLTHLPDTVWLKAKYNSTPDVVVRSQEPAWIRPFLKRFVSEKDRRYAAHDSLFTYHYSSQSMEGRRFYNYESEGLLRLRSAAHNGFSLLQRHGLITSADSTDLTDLQNLRRILHEDFVEEMDRAFIREHRFYVNGDYEGRPGEVELLFRAKKATDDRGRFVVDTVRCVVLSASRTVGRKSNIRLRTSPFMVGVAKVLSGFHIDDWHVDYRVRYAERGGLLYPAEAAYKMYYRAHESMTDKRQEEFQEQTGGGFSNMESTLVLTPSHDQMDATTAQDGEAAGWFSLPRTWYIKYNTDAERAYEVRLAHLPARLVVEEAE